MGLVHTLSNRLNQIKWDYNVYHASSRFKLLASLFSYNVIAASAAEALVSSFGMNEKSKSIKKGVKKQQ